MNNADGQYLEVANNILNHGVKQEDRTGTGTLSTFGIQMRFDLSKGFPLLTTKKLHTRSIILELIWFLTGKTNNNWLNERGVKIWDEWAAPDGSLGPIYGAQWRNWDPLSIEGDDRRGGIDQIADLINTIKNNPASRRQVVTAWNPSELPDMALSPCHCLFQTYVADGKLSLQLYQRSADLFLGVPFNIASYALLTHMLAQQCDLEVGEFIWVGGDTHIYTNHVEQMELQISREPRPLPTFRFARKPDSIDDYQLEDFIIEGYDPHPHIKGDVSV